MNGEPTDLLIFWFVVALRFFVPLLIPRYPLPAILASLVLDAADQTIFQTYTRLELAGYQGYDKALDIYYLSIAYISTMRNWTNQFAFQLSRFLFYFRLVGVVLFELTGARPLLLFFPNTFEYFFIFYELVRLRWDPARLGRAFWLAAAAVIWAFIKIPQEYWIHIAQLDVTDTISFLIYNALPGTPVYFILENSTFLLAVLLAGLIVLLWWLRRRLPVADHPWAVAAAPYQGAFSKQQTDQASATWSRRVIDQDLLEKIVLLTFLSVIFAQIMPGIRSTTVQLIVAVTVFVAVNTVVSHWLARRGVSWSTTVIQFAVMLVINSVMVLVYSLIMLGIHGSISVANALFFVLLLTLIMTLFDRFQMVYLARFPRGERRIQTAY